MSRRRKIPTPDQWRDGYWLQVMRGLTLAITVVCAAAFVGTTWAALGGHDLQSASRWAQGVGALGTLIGGSLFGYLMSREQHYPHRTALGEDTGWRWVGTPVIPPLFPLIIAMVFVCGVLLAHTFALEADEQSILGFAWGATIAASVLILVPVLPFHAWPGSEKLPKS